MRVTDLDPGPAARVTTLAPPSGAARGDGPAASAVAPGAVAGPATAGAATSPGDGSGTGTGTGTGTDPTLGSDARPVPGPGHGPVAAPIRVAAATPAPPGTRWPAGAPDWLRGPAGLAAAVVAGLLVGALVAGTLAERARLAAAEQVRLLADLMEPVREDGAADTVFTGMDVVNAGQAAVTVVGAEFTPGEDVVDVVARRRIEPGERTVVPVALTPACRGPIAETITLLVDTGNGDTTRVDAGSLGGRGLPGGRLRALCTRAEDPIDIWRVLARRDGTLTVQLLNTSAEDHEVGLRLPSGTSATSIPALPTTVPAGRSAFLQIRLRVDECTSEAQSASSGSGVRLSLDGDRGPTFEDDATAVTGWFAREVALACGKG